MVFREQSENHGFEDQSACFGGVFHMSPKLAPFRLLMPPMDRIFRQDSENEVPGAQFRPKWSILERNRAGMPIF